MTDAQKLEIVKTLLDDGTCNMPSDDKLNTYIILAGNEILSWKYHLIGGVPSTVTEVPSIDDGAQIYAVVAGYTHAGAEGEQTHIENGVHRHFIYEDMIGYIRNHVLPYVRVGAVT
jgi:hypothetical protein